MADAHPLRPSEPSFGRASAAVFLAYGAGLAANLVVSILVARTLGPEGAGVIALVLLGPNILALVGNLGLPNAISHFLRRRPFGARRVVGWASMLNLFAGLALMVGYLLAAPWLRTGLFHGMAEGGAAGPVPLGLVALAAAVIPLEIGIQNLMAVYQGLQRFGRRSAVMLSFRWLYAALAVGAVLLWRRDPVAVVAAGVAAYAVTYLAGYFAAGRSLRSEPRERPALRDAARLLGYGWRVHVSTLLVFLVLRVDLYLVQKLTGDPGEVGLYSRAAQVAEVILYLTMAMEHVLFPRMSGLPREAVPREAARLCRRGMLVAAGAVALFEAGSRWLILVPFGPEFQGSVEPLRILLPAVLALGLARMLFAVFNALERPWIPALVAAGGLALTTGLDLWWIPSLGLRGAALASLAGYAAMAVAALLWFRRFRNPDVPANSS